MTEPTQSPGAISTGFDFRAAVLEDAKEKLRMIRDEPRFELLLPSEADELLRALGETT
jgi:hypothetical protein